MKKAVVLFSGGLDSTTCIAYAKAKGFDCYALTFNYGQRHASELDAAIRVAKHFQVKHKIFNIDIQQFGGSALTDYSIAVPDFKGDKNIPVTYVPGRNTIFLSIALAWAEVLTAKDIFIGVSSVDYSHYPDCRPEYIEAYQHMASLATKAAVEDEGVTIHAPLLHLSKAQTVQLGLELGVDYQMTVSCYQADAEGRACGRCDCCVLRKKGFVEANVPDQTVYV